jgi:polyisoprenoid-binding protein YceI
VRTPALLLSIALAGTAAQAQPAVYDLDPDHSFVTFEVLHFGTSTVRGRFGPVSGAVTLDRAARSGEVSLRVPTAGVDTGIRVFNARLREPDLLAGGEFPEAYFVASRFSFKGDTPVEVRGEFTFRGVSQPLSLRAMAFACRIETPSQHEVCGGDFEAEFNRSDFGSTFGLPFIADRVRLVIQVEGLRR